MEKPPVGYEVMGEHHAVYWSLETSLVEIQSVLSQIADHSIFLLGCRENWDFEFDRNTGGISKAEPVDLDFFDENEMDLILCVSGMLSKVLLQAQQARVQAIEILRQLPLELRGTFNDLPDRGADWSLHFQRRILVPAFKAVPHRVDTLLALCAEHDHSSEWEAASREVESYIDDITAVSMRNGIVAPAGADDDEGYVLASELPGWRERFGGQNRLAEFLDKHPEIRQQKPHPRRRKVHVVDWVQHWIKEDRQKFKATGVKSKASASSKQPNKSNLKASAEAGLDDDPERPAFIAAEIAAMRQAKLDRMQRRE